MFLWVFQVILIIHECCVDMVCIKMFNIVGCVSLARVFKMSLHLIFWVMKGTHWFLESWHHSKKRATLYIRTIIQQEIQKGPFDCGKYLGIIIFYLKITKKIWLACVFRVGCFYLLWSITKLHQSQIGVFYYCNELTIQSYPSFAF
jgi:hypothetical protein